MATCSDCGAAVAESATYCRMCGELLVDDNSETDSTASVPEPEDIREIWPIGIVIAVAGWFMLFIFATILPDGLIAFLLFGSWILLPVAIAKDMNQLSDVGWPEHRWAYLLGAIIWLFAIITGMVYLWKRRQVVPTLERQQIEAEIAALKQSFQPDSVSEDTTTKDQTVSSTLNAILSEGDAALDVARTRHESGDSVRAIESYTTAIAAFELALTELDEDDLGRDAIVETIEKAQQERATLQEHGQLKDELHQHLQAGCENLQTALCAHGMGEDTLARTRFRQATQHFDIAKELVDDAASNLLDPPVTVEVSSSRVPATAIEDLRKIPDGVCERLADRDMTTVDDLQSYSRETLEDICDELAIGPDTTGRIGSLSEWHGPGEYTFESSPDILACQESAAYGLRRMNK